MIFSIEAESLYMRDYQRRTPLHWAALRGRKKVVKILAHNMKKARMREQKTTSTATMKRKQTADIR